MRPGLALGLPLPWRVAILGLSGVAWVFLLASLGNARVPAVAAAIAAFRSCFVGMGVVRKHHCWLCGMTHAFNALHRGHVAEALKFNGNCLWLFGLMLVLCAAAPIVLILGARQKSRNRHAGNGPGLGSATAAH